MLGRLLTVLRFGEPVVSVGNGSVECRYPIVGGALTSQPGGWLAISQRERPGPELEVAVSGYHPRLAGRGATIHRGLLYTALQAPLHRSVSRRFLAGRWRSP